MTAALKTREAAHPPMTASEEARLEQIECVLRDSIPENRRLSVVIAESLTEIRDAKLYRKGWRTFEHYMEDRWGLSRFQGHRLASLGDCAKEFKAAGLPAPTTERQTRPIPTGAAPETKVAIWREATEAAGGGVPTSPQVEAAAAKVLNRPLASRVKPPADPVERARAAGIVPEGAEVETVHPEPGPELDEEPAPQELTVGERLALLPERQKLSARVRAWFDAEAETYWELKPARDAFRAACQKPTGRLSKATSGRVGPWLSRHKGYFLIEGPGHWRACDPCKGTGVREIFGNCPDCKGHGYYVR